MNSVERVKQICKDRKIPIYKLERDLGFSNGYIGQLKKGVFPDDRLKSISDYLSVSTTFLMTGGENEPDRRPLQQPEIDKIMLREFNKLNDFGKHAAVDYIKEMQRLTLYVAAEKEMVIAAHNDVESPEETKLMQEDVNEID